MGDSLWSLTSKPPKIKYLLAEEFANSVKDIKILLLEEVFDSIDIMEEN